MTSEPKQEVRVHIRWMIRRDMPEVLAIEAGSFEFPWLEEDFIRCLRQRNCIGMVAEHEDRVVGFMIYELNKNRIQVLNFATAPEHRRQGVGTQMVAKLIGKLSAQRRNRIALEVRETNLAAQLFFRDSGFRAVSVLRGFYEDTPEDAYLMQYRFRPERPAALVPHNRIEVRRAARPAFRFDRRRLQRNGRDVQRRQTHDGNRRAIGPAKRAGVEQLGPASKRRFRPVRVPVADQVPPAAAHGFPQQAFVVTVQKGDPLAFNFQ